MNKEHIERLKKDFVRYINDEKFSYLRLFFYARRIPGLHYMMWLRFSSATVSSNISVLNWICEKRLKHLGVKYGFDILSDTDIGGGFLIRHFGMLIINHLCVIGENCTVVPGTIIGKSKGKVPRIGRNVEIGANATIIGGVVINDGAIIGAGSVVVHNVEGNSVVAGNPAKRIK